MSETSSYAVQGKGLRQGAVGFWASVGVGMASTAPAYSLAATLGFVVAVSGVVAPLVVILAFIPMFLCSWAIKEMNAVDPDCGTSFTWAWRAIGPRTGGDRPDHGQRHRMRQRGAAHVTGAHRIAVHRRIVPWR